MRNLLTIAGLFAALLFSTSSHAAGKLFDLVLNAQPEVFANAEASTRSVVGQVSFTSVAGDDLQIGDVYEIALPMGTVVSGEVIMNLESGPIQGHGEEFVSASNDAKVLVLEDDGGSLQVHLVGNTVAGITLNDTDNQKIYRARIDDSGTGSLAEIDPNSILCFDLTFDPNEAAALAELVATIPGGLSETVVRNLESRPGAANTVYIDNWGGVIEGTLWNTAYNSGNPINYSPYSFDDDETAFSDRDIEYIWLAWAKMSEDYSDLDVNVTTSRRVFDSTPIPNRARLIATNDQAWLGRDREIGGIAWLGGFGGDDEFTNTAWSFYNTPGLTGLVHSHESGHMMGLVHDGIGSSEYYGGHGNWGPIMGNPGGKQYTQWSKGEYPNATNREDDLSILASVLGRRADDVGDAPASANELEATAGTNYSITPDGLTPDKDVFAFTIRSPQEVSIDVAPTLASAGYATGANAALNVDLRNSANAVIESITSADNTPLRPNTNTFSFSGMLEADTYYLTVDAVSPNTNWATGFGEYGNGGEYRLTADIEFIDPQPSDPGMVTPLAGTTLAGYTDTFSWLSNGTNVAEYWVYVGSESVPTQYGNSRSLSSTTLSYTPTGLPLDGSEVYVTLFWLEEGATEWQSVVYTYTAATGDGPAFTSPQSGNTLASVSDTFTWTDNDSGATQYWLYLGSDVGAKDYYNSGLLEDVTSELVQAYLPTDESTVYGRLWYRATSSDKWLFVDDTFVAASSGGPTITSPLPGGTISSSPVTLTWEAGDATVTEWWVYVGTSVGSNDVYSSGSLGSSLTASVPMPTADVPTAHVTLWFKIGGIWRSTNYVYQVGPSTLAIRQQ